MQLPSGHSSSKSSFQPIFLLHDLLGRSCIWSTCHHHQTGPRDNPPRRKEVATPPSGRNPNAWRAEQQRQNTLKMLLKLIGEHIYMKLWNKEIIANMPKRQTWQHPKSGTREQKPTFVQQTENKKDCIGLFSVPTRKNPTILGADHQTSYFGQQMYIEYACARADTHISIIIYIYIYLHKKSTHSKPHRMNGW